MPQTLSTTIKRVYTAFFYTDSAQHLWQEEEALFSHFVTTLNDAFEWALTSEDIAYENGNKIMNVPTPLHHEPWPFHISTQENFSYGPATLWTCQSPSYPHAVHCRLTYEEDNTSSLTLENNSSEDEDCPTVSLGDNFWMEEPVPERHLCIHENAQHDQCPYPCPYSLNQLNHAQEDAVQYIDLDDIFDFPDVMYLPTMIIYQVWKISWNFDTVMEYACDTLLIKDS